MHFFGGGVWVHKSIRGCVASMGCNISRLVHQWPHVKCRIWYMKWVVFKSFQNLLKFSKIYFCNFAWSVANIRTIMVYGSVSFLRKVVYVWSTLKFSVAQLYQNQTWVPPPQACPSNPLQFLYNMWWILSLHITCIFLGK